MIEFDRPSILRSPLGDLIFNGDAGGGRWYLIDFENATVSRGLRVTKDAVPQGDGDVHHRRFSNGTELTVPVKLLESIDPDTLEGEAACGADLREMLEDLAGHLQAALNGSARWLWTPTGADQRMLDEARWLVGLSRSYDPRTKITTVTFGIDSPFPYFITAAQEFPVATDGLVATITNDGNHEFFPVIQVDGPTSAFTIENQTSGLLIDYDSSLPGAQAIGSGDYAEFDAFQNKVYLNGDEDNLKPGVNPLTTDYFSLLPGTNDILITGADATFLFNDAWIPA